jgi:hypothetical protein
MKMFGLYSKFKIGDKFYECVGFVKTDGAWNVLAHDGSTIPLKQIENLFN